MLILDLDTSGDAWKCVICSYNRKCVAHHLNSYTKFPNIRYDISNGVTLCRLCHINFHKFYGNITTSDQFFEFKFLNAP